MPSKNGHAVDIDTSMEVKGVNNLDGSAKKNKISQLFRLDYRTVILTGGLGGLGTELTETLLLSGADVFSTDMAVEPPSDIWKPLQTTASRTHTRLTYHPLDVTSEESVDAAFATLASTSRHPLRGLVACAGISGRAPATEYPLSAFRKILEVNVTGTFLCARAAAKLMQSQNVPGSIVLLASMSGTVVNQGVDTCAYNASKAAVLQLARNFAAEWGSGEGGRQPIRVNTLSPGYIKTPITMPTFKGVPGLKELWNGGNMFGRLSEVGEHRAAVVFLLGNGSSYVTGADLKADGGHTAW